MQGGVVINKVIHRIKQEEKLKIKIHYFWELKFLTSKKYNNHRNHRRSFVTNSAPNTSPEGGAGDLWVLKERRGEEV